MAKLQNIRDRLERLSTIDLATGCWTWQGSLNNWGYGSIQMTQPERKLKRAHRVAYEEYVGPIPDGLTIDHLCKNRACINWEHMEPVSMKENTMRGSAPSALFAKKTECIRGHQYTEENTYLSKGHRSCRLCSSARYKAKRGVHV